MRLFIKNIMGDIDMIRALYLALYLVYTFPYPPHSGYDLRVWNILHQFIKRMELTVLSYPNYAKH